MPMNAEGKTCNCAHHKVLPWLVILFGVLFLLENLGVSWVLVSWVWPILVVLAGCAMLMKKSCKCCDKK
jgi:hypothetical protein